MDKKNVLFWLMCIAGVFALAGIFQGINDTMWSSSKMYLGMLLLHTADPVAYGLPTVPPCMWEIDPKWGILSSVTFLAGIFVAMGFLLTFSMFGRFRVKKNLLIFLGGMVSLFSGCWDWIFATLVNEWWSAEARGDQMLWWPIGQIGGETFGISFTHEFGWIFIAFRLVLALIIIIYVASSERIARQKNIDEFERWID